MSRAKNTELIPLYKLPEITDRLRMNITLPEWVESDRIGVNVKRAEKLLNLSGISKATVRSERSALHSEVPQSVGITQNGELIAGKVSQREENPVGRSSQKKSKKELFRNLEWTRVHIWLNLLAIEEKLGEEKKKLREVESWVPHLDKGIRRSIREEGTRHLIQDFTKEQLNTALFIYVHNILMSAADVSLWDIISHNFDPHLPTPLELAIPLVVQCAGWNLLYTITNRKKYRISLLPGFEIDRAALLQFESRQGNILEVIPRATQSSGVSFTR